MPIRRPAQPAAPAAPAQPDSAVNLGQAAEQIGGLNLFGDSDDGAPAGDDQELQGRQPDDTDDGDSDDALASQDDETGDDDGSPDGQPDDTPDGDEDSEDGEATSEQDADSEDSETPKVESLTDLAAALEVEPEFFDNLELTFRADGEDVTVNLAELRQGYQRDANYRRQTQELADTRRQYDTQEQERQQNFEANVVQLGQVLQQGEQLLVGQIDSVEMQKLRQENPAEWSARRQEIQQRIEAVQGLYAHAAQQYDAFQAQQLEATRAAMQELRQTEMANLELAVPGWGEDVRAKLTSYLDSSFGFTESDLAQVFDSRLISLANKARLYDEMQAVSKKTKKKVAQLPKVQKPAKGATKGKTGNVANLRKARSQLKKTGKVRDAAALIGLAVKEL